MSECGSLRAATKFPSGAHPTCLRIRQALERRPPIRSLASEAIAAAVLIGIFEGADRQPHVWLVRRPATLRTHAGQVALPGGKRDPSDPSLVETALREAEEEIGLRPADVEVLGIGDDLATVTGFVVTPVVGWIRAPFEPRPNEAEVARAFSVPIATFRPSRWARVVPSRHLRRLLQTHRVDGEVIWGATAAILSTFVAQVGL